MVSVSRELTKRFEETWHGTLAEACERASATPPRGEHVLVVAGAPSTAGTASADGTTGTATAAGAAGGVASPSEEEIRAAVASRMSAGASRREAAAGVAAELGLSKRFAYETSLQRGDR